MRSDGGFEPDPNPYRPIPVDFAGPICAQCSHAWTNHTDPGHRDYLCDGFDPTVIRPAQLDTITGKVHDAMLRYVYCHEKNDQGQCDRFIPKPSPTTLVQIRRATRYRRLAGRLGSWLVAWSKRG
jgi:hypothetical protein